MLRYNVTKILFGMSVAMLMMTTVPGAARQRTIGDPAMKQIRDVLDRQVQAWNRRDLEGFMRGYWRSPELTFYSGGTTVSGWEETLARYRNRYQSEGKEMGHLQFTAIKIELLGPGAAFVRGRFYLKMTSTESSGLFTLTFKKLADGWKIIHDHTSTA